MSADNTVSEPPLEVIYDGDCPFCSSYVDYCRLKDAFPNVILTNARTVPGRIADFRREGIDINEGMIVIYGGATYFGDRAMAILTQISRSDATFQRFFRFLFRWPFLAVPVYNALRMGRNLTLILLGRGKVK